MLSILSRIKQFFTSYGQGFGPGSDDQRKVMEGLNYSQFRAADNSYLDPIREMKADQAKREGKASEVAPPSASGHKTSVLFRFTPFLLIGLLALFALAMNLAPKKQAVPTDPATIPEAPKKSIRDWSLDLLLWGGFAIILIAASSLEM